MSAGTRVSLKEAALAADRVVAILHPACDRLEIAGSIRRRSPSVGDIELVGVPRIETEPDGMFGQHPVNRLTELLGVCVMAGVFAVHPTDPKRGERYSKLIDTASGLQLDIFSASPDTFGLIFLIRTGPASYSQGFVTALHQRSLHAAGGALHRGSGWSDQRGWHPPLGCPRQCEVVSTREEADVYRVAGWQFLPPEVRS